MTEPTYRVKALEEKLAIVNVWLPRAVSDYERQAELNGFSADVSIGMLKASFSNPAAAIARIKAQAIREAAEHVERTHRHIPETRVNHGVLEALHRVKEYARQIEGQSNG